MSQLNEDIVSSISVSSKPVSSTYSEPAPRKRKSYWVEGLMVLLFTFLMGGEYWQVIPLPLPALDGLRDSLFGTVDQEKGHRVYSFLLTITLLVFLCRYLLLSIRTQRRQSFLFTQRLELYSSLGFVAVILMTSVLALCRQFHTILSTNDHLVFLSGLAVSQWLAVKKLKIGPAASSPLLRQRIIIPLIVALALLSQFQPDWTQWNQLFKYRDAVRWTGVCRNPNHFGLLMALGIILSAGFAMSLNWRIPPASCPRERYQWIIARGLLIGGIVSMTISLVMTYSRGAWLATFLGLSYLAYSQRKSWKVTGDHILHKLFIPQHWQGLFRTSNMVKLLLIASSVVIIVFWMARHTEGRLARRVFSVANANDFSWRNRVYAYWGALQMIADKALLGYGWDQAEKQYTNNYRDSKVSEGLAILLNCYFMVGITLGIAALAGFLGYIWISFGLTKSKCATDPPLEEAGTADWLKRTAQAGVIALLLGFWFDRGLFLLSLSIPFWILLEVGRKQWNETSQGHGISFFKCSLPVVFGSLFFLSMGMAVNRNPFERLSFSIDDSSGKSLRGSAFVAKPMARHPVIVFFYGNGSNPLHSGEILRDIAEQGFAAVAMEYSSSDQKRFEKQIQALHHYLNQQDWVEKNQIAWIGVDLSGERMIQTIVQQSQILPKAVVTLGGRWTGQQSEFASLNPAGPIAPSNLPPVLVIQAEKDEFFPPSAREKLMRKLEFLGMPLKSHVVPNVNRTFEEKFPSVLQVAKEFCAAQLPLPNYAKHMQNENGKTAFNLAMQQAGLNRRALGNAWYSLSPSAFENSLPQLATLTPWQLTHLSENELQKALVNKGTGLEYGAWGLAILSLGILVFFVVRLRGKKEKVLRSRFDFLLSLFTIAAVGLALCITALQLAFPRLPINAFNMRLTDYLVPRAQQEVLKNSLLNPVYSSEKIGTVLEHVELANLQRRFFYSELSDDLFDSYVLSGFVDSKTGNEMRWRRLLWEYFFPRVRNESDIHKAAETIVALLRGKVTIDVNASVETIPTMWIRQRANEKGFHRIYVAALRSIGIAARLDKTEKPEIWNGTDWIMAPEPLP